MVNEEKARKITDNQIRSVAYAICDRYEKFHRDKIRPPDEVLALGPEQLLDRAAHCMRVLVRKHARDLEIPF